MSLNLRLPLETTNAEDVDKEELPKLTGAITDDTGNVIAMVSDEEDAQEIVKGCNRHEELVETIRALLFVNHRVLPCETEGCVVCKQRSIVTQDASRLVATL